MAICTALTATAQDMTHEKYMLADEVQLWRNSQNAAGLALDMKDSADNRGTAYFDLLHQSGTYHRVQEGNQLNQLRFFTERYQKIGKYFYGYGSFDFDMGRTKQRAWSDVLRTYNSNPFISGSSVFGKYDSQNFTLNAKLASIRLGHFNYGAALSYKVGDFSRLRDPRSRVRLADYQITPAVTYTTDSHTIGLAAYYHRYKEKLTGLTTVQTDPNLQYYLMSGMEYAQGSVGAYSSHWREYVNHEFGGELSYAFKGDLLHSVNALTYAHATDYTYGQYKYEPGRWYTNNYGLSTKNRLQAGSILHSLDAAVHYEEGYADQYNQELITERDGSYSTQYWSNKMTYRKRYQLKKLDLGIHYRQSFLDEDAIAGFVGFSYDYQSVSNKHLLATSTLKYASSLFGIEGGYGFLGKRLWVKVNANYRMSHKADLQLAEATTDYGQSVLIPDMQYYSANYWQGRLELLYQFPITIKGQHTLWFAKLYGSYLHANKSSLINIGGDESKLYGQTAGLSVGLYY